MSKRKVSANWFSPFEIVRLLIRTCWRTSYLYSGELLRHSWCSGFLTIIPSSWLDRIPSTLLLGISTSVELFEGRLPRSTVSLIKGKYFEIHEASNCVDHMYEALQAGGDSKFWLGRNITGILFERSSDVFQSPEGFIRMVKVCFFYINPFQVFMVDTRSTCICHTSLPTRYLYCWQTNCPPAYRMISYVRLSETYRRSESENLHYNRSYLV